MTPVETLRGESVALFGLGGSGLSTARALVDGGAEVAAWDDSPNARERAAAAGIRARRSRRRPTGAASGCSCSRPACR